MKPIPLRAGMLIGGWIAITLINSVLLPAHYAPQVQIEVVKPNPLPLIVRAPGVLQPKLSMTLKGEFDGPVVTKAYQEGQAVKTGQFLLEVGRDRIRTEYEAKTNALKNAKADLLKAQRDVKLQRILFKKQAVSQNAVEEAQRGLVRAEQTLDSARSAFHLEQDRWNKNKYLAPFNGTIVKDNLEEERTVSNGKEILTVADISEYSVKVRIDELEIRDIRVGQSAEIRIQAYEDKPLRATVTRMGTQAEGNALPEIPVYLKLDSARNAPLLPKLTAEARINVGEISKALSVPLTAIDNADGKTKVWALTRSNRLELRAVALGHTNPERAEITEGLKLGDRICIIADPHLAEGMKVRIGAISHD